MKKLHLVAYTTIALLIFFGCKKSSSSPKVSTWTFASKSYIADTTIFRNQGIAVPSEVIGSDASGNAAYVGFFSFNPSPGTYVVGLPLIADSTQCNVGVIIQNNVYFSIGKSGEKVTLTISGGKRTVTFNNITVVDGNDANGKQMILTGTLIEN